MHIMQSVYMARNKHFCVQKVPNMERYAMFSALLCNLYKHLGCRKKVKVLYTDQNSLFLQLFYILPFCTNFYNFFVQVYFLQLLGHINRPKRPVSLCSMNIIAKYFCICQYVFPSARRTHYIYIK